MNFLSPWYLLIGAPVLGGILLLYLLKIKRRDAVISSVLLWRHLVKDVQANAPFQKLRYSLLLLLQLIIAALLVYAFARPYIMTKGLKGKSFAIVLDGSASMQSTDVSKSRFDAAKREALNVVDGLSKGDEAMVVLASSSAKVLTTFTDDKSKLRNVLAAAHPADTGTNLRDAILVAAQASQKKREPRIYVLSDGATPSLDDLDVSSAQVDFVKIGKRCNNVGIVALDIRRGMSEDGEYECFAAVQNFSTESKQFSVELYLDDSILDVREMTLRAGAREAMVFSNFGEARGILKLQIDADDDLSVDNVAYANFTPKASVNTLLFTKGNMFLENALNSDPRIALSIASVSEWDKMAPAQRAAYDLLVFDGFAPKTPVEGSYLCINAIPPDGPASQLRVVDNPQVADWSRTHPIARYVSFETNRIGKAIILKPSVWGATVVETGDGPIIVAGERRTTKAIVIGFDLNYDNTDFCLHAHFPIFISNCVTWLTSKVAFGEEIMTRTGSPMAVDVPANTESVNVTKPNNATVETKVERRPFVFGDTDLAGLYLFKGKGFRTTRAASLVDRRESDTSPRDVMRIGGKELAHVGTARASKSEMWRLAVLLAIGVMALEWYAYHKRL